MLEDAFHTGLLLRDTNGDSIADAVCAHIVVPDSPNEGENAAAANLAARLGYETSGITLPIVTTAARGARFHAQCSPAATNLWVGRGAVPAAHAAELEAMLAQLQLGEGGVFSLGGGLAFAGADSLGLLSATNAYAARAPYQWSLPGPKLQELAEALNAKLVAAKFSAHAELIGLTYFNGKPGIQRAILKVTGAADAAAIRKALSPSPDSGVTVATAANVWQIMLPNGAPLVIPTGGSAPRVLPAMPETPAEDVRLLDLGQIYTFKGLLSGSPKKMVPSSVAARLYVGAGEPVWRWRTSRRGWRLKAWVSRCRLPSASGVTAAQAAGIPVVGDGSLLADHERNLLGAPEEPIWKRSCRDNTAMRKLPELGALQAGEGELRVIDRAFGKSPALLVRGDAQGEAAALAMARSTCRTFGSRRRNTNPPTRCGSMCNVSSRCVRARARRRRRCIILTHGRRRWPPLRREDHCIGTRRGGCGRSRSEAEAVYPRATGAEAA